MIVKDRMSSPAITAPPSTDTTTALRTMYTRKIHRLPVVDDRGRLIGIVTQRDLLEKSKGSAPISEVMRANPYTTTPEVSLIQVAVLMRDLGIGALPVLDHSQLVGVITESDVFDAFLELLGARRAGTRLIVPMTSLGEGLPRVLQALGTTKVPLTGLTTFAQGGRPAVIVTADEHDPRDLVRALRDAGFEPTLISVQNTAA